MSSRSDVMSAMSSSSADKPAMVSSSAAKPAMDAMDCIVAFYNITWDRGRFKNLKKHEPTIAADILTALKEFSADLVLLSSAERSAQAYLIRGCR